MISIFFSQPSLTCHIGQVRRTLITDLISVFANEIPPSLTAVLVVQPTSKSICSRLTSEREVLSEQVTSW